MQAPVDRHGLHGSAGAAGTFSVTQPVLALAPGAVGAQRSVP